MNVVELYGRVRHAVRIESLSNPEAAQRFGVDPRTVAKMLAFSAAPGYLSTPEQRLLPQSRNVPFAQSQNVPYLARSWGRDACPRGFC